MCHALVVVCVRGQVVVTTVLVGNFLIVIVIVIVVFVVDADVVEGLEELRAFHVAADERPETDLLTRWGIVVRVCVCNEGSISVGTGPGPGLIFLQPGPENIHQKYP